MASGGAGLSDPMHQFNIVEFFDFNIGSLHIAYTNSALMMTIGLFLGVGLLVLGARKSALVPSRGQAAAEVFYEFVASMVKDNVGPEGKKYFPFVLAIFMMVLSGNLLGMMPFAFTHTSHIIVTFSLALIVFITCTIVGFARHGLHFLSFFVPPGAPLWMMPLVVPIEFISYLSRPISLSVRLFANMLVGHTMLKIFASFAVAMGALGIFPVIFNIAFVGFELFVAAIQAYVFALLTCIYLHDSVHMH